MSVSNDALLYVALLAFFALIDWLLPDNLKLVAFRLFGSGEEYEGRFNSFYRRWFVFRMVVDAIIVVPLCFFMRDNDGVTIATVTFCMLQIVFFIWRAEIYARRSIEGKTS